MDVRDILVVIPARYASTRFPGKPLAKLQGRDGVHRSLVEWSWRSAIAAFGSSCVVVATDDERITEEVARFGGQCAFTPSDLRNGTERCAFHVESLKEKPRIVVNYQGDAPLIPPEFVKSLVAFALDRNSAMATPMVHCDPSMTEMLLSAAKSGRAGGTCVVSDRLGRALYFSKYPIPFGQQALLKMHIGLYAFTPEALAQYAVLSPSASEISEGLEQLRFLDAGIAIDLLELPLPETGIWELNNPDDIPVVERALKAM